MRARTPCDAPGPDAPHPGAWALAPDDRLLRRVAWSLVHDSGVRLELTRAEHAVVACLFAAGAQGADAAALTQAILQAWQAPSHRPLRRGANLPVVLGRLRAKARRAGVILPIQRAATRYSWVW